MGVSIDVGGIPNYMTDAGYKMLADLKALPEPEIVKTLGDDITKLAAVTPEEAAKLMPVVFENQFYTADGLVKTGKAVCDAVAAIGKVDQKAGLALGLGALALGGVFWLYRKVQDHEMRIQNLTAAVLQLQTQSNNVSAIGF